MYVLSMNDDHSFSCKLQGLMVSETSSLLATVDFNQMNYGKWILLKCVKTLPLSSGSWSLFSIAFHYSLMILNIT